MDQRHLIAESTLRELRDIVAAAQRMPAGSVVRVRTRRRGCFNADGALLQRVLIIEPEPEPADFALDDE